MAPEEETMATHYKLDCRDRDGSYILGEPEGSTIYRTREGAEASATQWRLVSPGREEIRVIEIEPDPARLWRVED